MDTREKLIGLQKALLKSLHYRFNEESCVIELDIDQTAANLITNGVTVQQWIPVTERLPEEDIRVIVHIEKGFWITEVELDTDRRHNNAWVRWGKAVTHWMPLPKPPEEDSV